MNQKIQKIVKKFVSAEKKSQKYLKKLFFLKNTQVKLLENCKCQPLSKEKDTKENFFVPLKAMQLTTQRK